MPFEPMARHQCGVVAGSAGGDLHGTRCVQDSFGIRAEDPVVNPPGLDSSFQRLRHGIRLLEDLLLHVVFVVAESALHFRVLEFPPLPNHRLAPVPDHGFPFTNHHDVAVLQQAVLG